MFAQLSKPTHAYSRVALDSAVPEADPHQLILMLFDGALLSVASAIAAIDRGDIAAKGVHISKTIEIITHGLRASLDFKSGGDLADKLGGLYDYLCTRLLFASLNCQTAALHEVAQLLGEIRGAWQQIGRPGGAR